MAALRVGATLAVEAGNFPFAVELCDKLAERFLVNALDVKLDVLAKGTLSAETSTKIENLAEACIATGFVALALDDFDRATKFVKLSRSVLQRSGDALVKQVQFLDEEIARIQNSAVNDSREAGNCSSARFISARLFRSGRLSSSLSGVDVTRAHLMFEVHDDSKISLQSPCAKTSICPICSQLEESRRRC